jgi:hypothetical protein
MQYCITSVFIEDMQMQHWSTFSEEKQMSSILSIKMSARAKR